MRIAGYDINAATKQLILLDKLPAKKRFEWREERKWVLAKFHFENNLIYQGSYFNHLPDEELLLDKLYTFNSAIPLAQTNLPDNYTHSTWITSEDNIESDGPLNRKLDYIFSSDTLNNGITHQEANHQFYLSDHAPVSATLTLPLP